MHARFYNPQIGRFLSVDSARGTKRLPQSWNRYAYALGNPLRFVDPDGLRAREYYWKTYKFVLDNTAHGGPHVDVFRKSGGRFSRLARVGRATGELLSHMGTKGSVPNAAMRYMRKKSWIPGLAGAVLAGAELFFTASPADAAGLPDEIMQAMEAEEALGGLVAEVAGDLFGPVDTSSLTAEELQEVMEEIETRADSQEQMQRDAETDLDDLIGFSCFITGSCPE